MFLFSQNFFGTVYFILPQNFRCICKAFFTHVVMIVVAGAFSHPHLLVVCTIETLFTN